MVVLTTALITLSACSGSGRREVSTTTTDAKRSTTSTTIPTTSTTRAADNPGHGWFLAHYDHSVEINEPGMARREPGTQDLYLVSPTGALHKVAEWPAEVTQREFRRLLDWSPDGRRALLAVGEKASLQMRLTEIDLESGAETTVFDAGATPTRAVYTRPTGENLLVSRSRPYPDNSVTIERRTRTGALLGELRAANKLVPAVLSVSHGTRLVFSTDDGIVLTTNTGAQPKGLLKGQGMCRPVRRWPDNHLLVSCFAPQDVTAGTVWDVDLATSRPRRVATGVDDALVAHGRTWVQLTVDSGGRVAVLGEDGSTITPVSISPSAGGGDILAGIDPVSGNIVVRSHLRSGDADGGWLGAVDNEGRRVKLLLDSPPSNGSQREVGLIEVIAFDDA